MWSIWKSQISNLKSQINSNDQNSKIPPGRRPDAPPGRRPNNIFRTYPFGLKSYFLIVNAIPEFCWDLGVLLYLVRSDFDPAGFGHWILEFEIYLEFGAWNLGFLNLVYGYFK